MNLIERHARLIEESLANAQTSSKKSNAKNDFGVPEEPVTLHQNKRAAKRCSPPMREQEILFEDLYAAQGTLLAKLKEYLSIENPGYMLLIRTCAGSGKTTAGVLLAHWVHRELDKRVLYLGPRHNFFADIQEASAERGERPSLWYEWLPRQFKMADPLFDTCRHTETITEFMRRGYQSDRFCVAICGRTYMENTCPFLAQAQRAEPMIYGNHQHVTVGHPIAKECKLLIGDENPQNSFSKDITISANEIYFSNVAPMSDLGQLLMGIKQRAMDGQSLSGFALYNALGIQDVIEACKPYTKDVIKKMSTPRLANPEDVMELSHNVLPTLIPLMLREAEEAAKHVGKNKVDRPFLERVHIRDGNLIIEARRSIAKEMPTHIIWFDATGDEKIYRELFERDVVVVEPKLLLTGKIYQAHDRSNSKSTMLKLIESNPNGETEVEFKKRAHEVREQVEKIIADGNFKSHAIICPQAMEAFLNAQAHFYGNRGTNSFKDADVIIVVGTPMAPIQQIEKMAKAIWFDRMEPFDNKWVTVERKYNYVDEDGSGWSIPVNQFADEALNAVLWQVREAELIQSVHRGRILYRDIPVYLLSNLPVDQLPPAKLMSLQDIMDAPDGTDVFIWHNFLKFMDEMYELKGIVFLSDIIEGYGISKPTAQRYMDILEESGEWEPPERSIKKKGPGRPPRATQRVDLNE